MPQLVRAYSTHLDVSGKQLFSSGLIGDGSSDHHHAPETYNQTAQMRIGITAFNPANRCNLAVSPSGTIRSRPPYPSPILFVDYVEIVPQVS